MTLAGSGRAHGAVTVVNAIPSGRGAAVGIDLWTEADVALEETAGPVDLATDVRGDVDPSLVEACVEVVAEHADTVLSGRVETRSEIPVARGLKSSSVTANATVIACLDALAQSPEAGRVLDLSLAAARRAGVTVTGALDDASASLLGGLVVTDNREDRVLRRERLNKEHRVLVLVPRERGYTADVDTLDEARPVTDRCLSLVDADAWPEALTLNGLGIAAALEQGLDPAYKALAAGATAAGTTGTGPAVAAVCPEDAAVLVRRAWEPYTARGHGILQTSVTNDAVLPGGWT